MANPYCTGPAHIFCGVGGGRRALYLGTAESAPVIEERPEYEPLMNDLGGSRKPFDFSHQGVDAIVSATLTRWNDNVMNILRNVPRHGTGVLAPGTSAFGDIGAFMVFEGAAYPLWVTFPYSAKVAFSSRGMVSGYRFFNAFLESPVAQNVGTRPRKFHLIWYAARAYNPRTGAMVCYDHTVTGLPAID